MNQNNNQNPNNQNKGGNNNQQNNQNKNNGGQQQQNNQNQQKPQQPQSNQNQQKPQQQQPTAKKADVKASSESVSTLSVIATLILGVIIGFTVGLFWQRGEVKAPSKEDVMLNDTSDATTTTSAASETINTGDTTDVTSKVATDVSQANGGTALSVSNQRSGATTLVDSITTSDVTWVAVREIVNGSIGNVLGAQRLPAGTFSDVSVELLRPTKAGSLYAVMLYKDDGDLSFDTKKDKVIVEGEKPVSSMYVAQ